MERSDSDDDDIIEMIEDSDDGLYVPGSEDEEELGHVPDDELDPDPASDDDDLELAMESRPASMEPSDGDGEDEAASSMAVTTAGPTPQRLTSTNLARQLFFSPGATPGPARTSATHRPLSAAQAGKTKKRTSADADLERTQEDIDADMKEALATDDMVWVRELGKEGLELRSDPKRAAKAGQELQRSAAKKQRLRRYQPTDVDKHTQEILAEVGRRGLQTNFDVESYVRAVIENIDAWKKDADAEHILYAGGATQSGKSAFKSVLILIAQRFGLAVVVVTKGVGESKDLTEKLLRQLTLQLNGHGVCKYMRSVSQFPGQKWASSLEDCINNHGVIVTAHTASQVNKVTNAIRDVQEAAEAAGGLNVPGFIVAFDESDDFQRREIDAPEKIQLEKAHERLRDHGPALQLNVSATLLSLFGTAQETGNTIYPNQVFQTELGANYHGLLSAKAMVMSGKKVFLEHGELGPANTYINSKVLHLCRAWRDYGHGALGLLVCNPRVTAYGNILTMGSELHTKHGFGNTCIVAVSGSKMQVLGPNAAAWSESHFGDKKRFAKISDVLNELDRSGSDHFVGLGVPIMVIGYSKMERCVSYRSHTRVPTHMLMSLGKALSIDRLVQAFGRATFLHPPAHFKGTVVLANGSDWDAARAYIRFQSKLMTLVTRENCTVQSILQSHTFEDQEDFRKFNDRTVGHKRAMRDGHLKFKGKKLGWHGDHREGTRAAHEVAVGSDDPYAKDLHDIARRRSTDPALRWATRETYCALLLGMMHGRFAAAAAAAPVGAAAGPAGADEEDEVPVPVSKTLVTSSLADLVRKNLLVKRGKGAKDTEWAWAGQGGDG